MDDYPSQQNNSVQSQKEVGLLWAKPSGSFDLSAVKPHACMTDIVQRGNYIHCNTGNHGMRLPADKQLTKDAVGNWTLKDIIVIP